MNMLPIPQPATTTIATEDSETPHPTGVRDPTRPAYLLPPKAHPAQTYVYFREHASGEHGRYICVYSHAMRASHHASLPSRRCADHFGGSWRPDSYSISHGCCCYDDGFSAFCAALKPFIRGEASARASLSCDAMPCGVYTSPLVVECSEAKADSVQVKRVWRW